MTARKTTSELKVELYGRLAKQLILMRKWMQEHEKEHLNPGVSGEGDS